MIYDENETGQWGDRSYSCGFCKNTTLNCQDQSDSAWFMMKMRPHNDVTNSIGLLYTENEIKLSYSIR